MVEKHNTDLSYVILNAYNVTMTLMSVTNLVNTVILCQTLFFTDFKYSFDTNLDDSYLGNIGAYVVRSMNLSTRSLC